MGLNKVFISDSGPKVSEAIYGFWRWHKESDMDFNEVERVVQACLDLGINTFDLADIYGNYEIERNVGKMLKNKNINREDIVLFTKSGLCIPSANFPNIRHAHLNSTREHVIKSIDQSLQNLGTDYIDVYLINHFDFLTGAEELASTIHHVVETKKVKHIGIVNFSKTQHELLNTFLRVPIVTSHIELNIFENKAITDGRLDYINQNYSKPLAWAPLAGGRFVNGRDKKSVAVRDCLTQFAEKYNSNIESIAIAWLHKLGALPLLGTLDLKRLQNAVDAYQIELDRQDWYQIYYIASEEY